MQETSRSPDLKGLSANPPVLADNEPFWKSIFSPAPPPLNEAGR